MATVMCMYCKGREFELEVERPGKCKNGVQDVAAQCKRCERIILIVGGDVHWDSAKPSKKLIAVKKAEKKIKVLERREDAARATLERLHKQIRTIIDREL